MLIDVGTNLDAVSWERRDPKSTMMGNDGGCRLPRGRGGTPVNLLFGIIIGEGGGGWGDLRRGRGVSADHRSVREGGRCIHLPLG